MILSAIVFTYSLYSVLLLSLSIRREFPLNPTFTARIKNAIPDEILKHYDGLRTKVRTVPEVHTTSCSLKGGSQHCRARHCLDLVVFDLLMAVPCTFLCYRK